MLYLTGGITNPFSLLLIALAVLAAATLPGRHALVIGSLTLLASLLLTVMPLPLHSGGGLHSASQTLISPMGLFTANALGIAITAGYAWVAACKARGIELATDVTQTVLAREQKLSALGGGWPSPPPTNWARRWPESLLSRGKWRARPSPAAIGQTPS